MSTLLITGGAGYIGSHAVRHLHSQGHQIVVLDDLVYGHQQAILDDSIEFVQGKVGDVALLESLFSKHPFDAVMHFAAWASVGESVAEPLKYYRNNTADALSLLEVMQNHGCQKFVFSSTAASYGNPEFVPMTEEHPQGPINPYGWSKLFVEQILRDSSHSSPLRYAILRYFNACGAALDGLLGEDHEPETHLIPRALLAIRGEVPPLKLFGTDYPTADGTCIRDYIHVEDLAQAHGAALEHLLAGKESLQLNLGTGQGTSVREILQAIEEITGHEVPHEVAPRREGDPPELVANPSLAEATLRWKAKYNYRDAIEHAWAWMNGPSKGRF